MSQRPKFPTRTILLRTEQQREQALALLKHVPLDDKKPLELVVSEQQKKRGPDANSLMWAGPLRDLAEQGWLEQRRYSAEAWHELAKREFLPEEYDPELCLKGYRKWERLPGSDERILVGSTTMLTVKGMALHIEQLHALGGSLGVQFHANPNERFS